LMQQGGRKRPRAAAAGAADGAAAAAATDSEVRCLLACLPKPRMYVLVRCDISRAVGYAAASHGASQDTLVSSLLRLLLGQQGSYSDACRNVACWQGHVVGRLAASCHLLKACSLHRRTRGSLQMQRSNTQQLSQTPHLY
jgi:hypothetical protein